VDALLFSGSAGSGTATFENYSGLTSPIRTITWWGAFADDPVLTSAIACTPESSQFEVKFYADNAGSVGALFSSQTVNAAAAATGQFYFERFPAWRYRAALPQAVDLPGGWIKIRHLADVEDADCYFGLIPSAAGDGISRSGSGSVVQQGDAALCMGAASEIYSADSNSDLTINLSELLRVVQFYNSARYGCAPAGTTTEDGYMPSSSDESCLPHATDYKPQNWHISLPELLRVIQFYNSNAYHYCPADGTEDDFCPGHS
jgi:hypothetical protein